MISVPVFDVEACRQHADEYPSLPLDPTVADRIWRQLVADLEAALDHIEIQQAALQQRGWA